MPIILLLANFFLQKRETIFTPCWLYAHLEHRI